MSDMSEIQRDDYIRSILNDVSDGSIPIEPALTAIREVFAGYVEAEIMRAETLSAEQAIEEALKIVNDNTPLSQGDAVQFREDTNTPRELRGRVGTVAGWNSVGALMIDTVEGRTFAMARWLIKLPMKESKA